MVYVSDGYSDLRLSRDWIAVTINVTNVDEPGNDPPAFTEGDSTTRSVPENTAAGTNIGMPVTAADVDNTTLTYTLHGTDASAFSIVSTTGQLQTNAALDFESKNIYSVTIDVSDSNGGSDSIDVTINVTDVDEPGNDPPTFTEGSSTTRSISENAPSGRNVGALVDATDSDGDRLIYTLGGTDAAAFRISAQMLWTNAALDYETQSSYSVTISVSDGNGGSDSIAVTINVTAAPVFTEGTTATRSVAENTRPGTNIGAPVAATDADSLVLTYSLGGTDADSFSIVDTTGQLQTKAALDYETKTSYSVKITVFDGDVNYGFDHITVTIDVTDEVAAAPPLTPENTALLNNFPNPFNPETWIPYQLAEPAEVTLTIYNVRGVVVRRLALGHQPAGVYTSRNRAIHWDGRNGVGEKVASGLYFYTLTAGDYAATRKLLIRK